MYRHMYTTYNISSDLHVDCHHDNYLNLFDVIASRCSKKRNVPQIQCIVMEMKIVPQVWCNCFSRREMRNIPQMPFEDFSCSEKRNIPQIQN